MVKCLARRVLATVPVVIGVTLITFALMHATAGSYIPGPDLNPKLKPEDAEAVKRYLRLDRPLYLPYLTWLPGIRPRDFGRSVVDRSPRSNHIFPRLPAT